MNAISMNLVTLFYLVASVCFIQALKGLSSPSTARLGNTFGMAGMAIAVLTTIALMLKLQERLQQGGGLGFGLVLLGVVVGGALVGGAGVGVGLGLGGGGVSYSTTGTTVRPVLSLGSGSRTVPVTDQSIGASPGRSSWARTRWARGPRRSSPSATPTRSSGSS